ncbi:hypothetical protein OFAG_02210 [Oxalobacter formigenes HOxBLS]|uniref:Uncharacterized protein n=1 Tax=Oxalobacter paraformigenes TaxID=556268 RepID=T5LEE3_9BURK|nr:hypothetical protein OFAG_02210 [Oxalobacter paraformigenes]
MHGFSGACFSGSGDFFVRQSRRGFVVFGRTRFGRVRHFGYGRVLQGARCPVRFVLMAAGGVSCFPENGFFRAGAVTGIRHWPETDVFCQAGGFPPVVFISGTGTPAGEGVRGFLGRFPVRHDFSVIFTGLIHYAFFASPFFRHGENRSRFLKTGSAWGGGRLPEWRRPFWSR